MLEVIGLGYTWTSTPSGQLVFKGESEEEEEKICTVQMLLNRLGQTSLSCTGQLGTDTAFLVSQELGEDLMPADITHRMDEVIERLQAKVAMLETANATPAATPSAGLSTAAKVGIVAASLTGLVLLIKLFGRRS